MSYPAPFLPYSEPLPSDIPKPHTSPYHYTANPDKAMQPFSTLSAYFNTPPTPKSVPIPPLQLTSSIKTSNPVPTLYSLPSSLHPIPQFTPPDFPETCIPCTPLHTHPPPYPTAAHIINFPYILPSLPPTVSSLHYHHTSPHLHIPTPFPTTFTPTLEKGVGPFLDLHKGCLHFLGPFQRSSSGPSFGLYDRKVWARAGVIQGSLERSSAFPGPSEGPHSALGPSFWVYDWEGSCHS